MHKNKSTFAKKGLWGILALIAVALITGTYLHYHHANPNLGSHSSKAKITGTLSEPTEHKVPAGPASGQSGGVSDQNGDTTIALPPASKWVTSDSGNVTLQLPSADATIKTGDTLAGLAKVDNVEFILTDNSVGKIAEGGLHVVSGKFAGKLQFTAHADQGKLEVFYRDPSNGAEKDLVEINVNFIQ